MTGTHRRPRAGALAVLALAPALTITVHPGDTLWGIARSHGVSLTALEAANPQFAANYNLIYPGQSVTLPAASQSPTGTGPVASPAQSAAVVGNVSPASFRACVIQRESGGDITAQNPASTASGKYQFLLSTWDALGYGSAYPGGAKTAPEAVQDEAFARAYALWGVSPWRPYDGC